MMRLVKKMIWAVLAFGVSLPLFSYAQDTYTPISPVGAGGDVNLDDPDSYLGEIFLIFIALAAILAVVRLMICGIQYMTSEAPGVKADAKSCIGWVVGGLLLIFLSFLILETINTDLTSVTFDRITTNIEENVDLSGDPSSSFNYAGTPRTRSGDDEGPGGGVASLTVGGDDGWCFITDGGFGLGNDNTHYCGPEGSPWDAGTCVAEQEEADTLTVGIIQTCYCRGIDGDTNDPICQGRTGAEARILFDGGYDERETINQGFCYGDTGFFGGVYVECGDYPDGLWTRDECLAESGADDLDLPLSCTSSSDGSIGTGVFCFDVTEAQFDDVGRLYYDGTGSSQCDHDDSLECQVAAEDWEEEDRWDVLSPCYRPEGSTP